MSKTCVMAGVDGIECFGNLEAAHGFGKGAFPSVRYERWNTLGPLCSLHHSYYTRHPLQWDFRLWKAWGPALYAERYILACSTRKLNLADVRAALESSVCRQ